MNDITIFIFGLSFAAVVGATFAFMWKMTGAVLEDVNKPRKPQRTVHPEMKDVPVSYTHLTLPTTPYV